MWTPRSETDQLKQELDDLRYEQERDRCHQKRREQECRAELEREREANRERWREEQCRADSWPEAFEKGIPRFRVEADAEGERTHVRFFRDLMVALEAAEVAYREEMAAAEEAIKRVRQDALARAADRVAGLPSGGEIAQALREDNHEWLVVW